MPIVEQGNPWITIILHPQPVGIAATHSARVREWSPTTSHYANFATAIHPYCHSSVRQIRHPKNPRSDQSVRWEERRGGHVLGGRCCTRGVTHYMQKNIII